MRYGVFGGTFDPPHNGHLTLAQAALAQLNLDRVLWVVTSDPPHKQGWPLSPVQDRLDMVLAAIAGQPQFEVSRVDIDRPGPHWAADTVGLLKQAHPQVDLVYLMGGDSLRDLPTWGRPRELLANAALGVLLRPGAEVEPASLEQELPGITGKVAFVSAPRSALSSHDLRQRVAGGKSIDGMTPPGVAALIEARGLYRPSRNKNKPAR
jgi:nicotinate-nucleotide adenylyltransferase